MKDTRKIKRYCVNVNEGHIRSVANGKGYDSIDSENYKTLAEAEAAYEELVNRIKYLQKTNPKKGCLTEVEIFPQIITVHENFGEIGWKRIFEDGVNNSKKFEDFRF